MMNNADVTETLRSLEPREVTCVLLLAMIDPGAPAADLAVFPSELDAVRAALMWAQPGDLLVLPTHVQKDEVEALLDALSGGGWQAGSPLPAV